MVQSKKALAIICIFAMALCSVLTANTTKPKLKPAPDGFPTGHDTPEGVASDLARAFIGDNVKLFSETCIGLYLKGKAGEQYDNFMRSTIEKMEADAKQRGAGTIPPLESPKSIIKVFAARHLSGNGPASYGYATFNFQDVMFVDVSIQLHSGKRGLNRTLVIKEPDGKWYVHPAPNVDPLLSYGLNDETKSVVDFSEAYYVQK